MNPGVPNWAAASDELRQVYAVIQDEMEEIEEALRRELKSSCRFVDRMLKHGFQLGGKRLRPALVLLAGKVGGQIIPDHITIATAVELVHTASLIHDDVLDEAVIRRHLDTVNARWDNEASVLLGDYLLARAMSLAVSLDTMEACREIAEAGHRMCHGELRQIATRGHYDLDEHEYLNIISEKTASLYAACGRLGARYAGADADVCERFARFGINLGIAFQIVDDILDIWGDEGKMGKSLGTDLCKQKPTLPLIYLLESMGEADKAEVVAVLRDHPDGFRTAVRRRLVQTDAMARAERKAQSYVLNALEVLEPLPKSPAT
ncbi:MAG: polyprenyl synthetase family protein, partial [Thermogutta sp.]|nr:polyprenyl synthetase family protein [Thermogutta sp.]